jgi:Phosphotransferase enzyme family
MLSSRPPSLPSLAVASGGRPVEHLVTATERKYQLESYCLWTGYCPIAHADPVSGNFVVMEVLDQNVPAPSGMLWASPREALSRVDPADGAVIRNFVEDLARYGAALETAPFARPAWIRELFSWASTQLQPFGLRITGGFWQLNASPTFSLIRLQTNRTAVWFKATGEPNAHELPVSVSLARLIPEYVPRILGVHSSWNGWLSFHVPGRLLDGIGDRSAWGIAARGLAQLQIRSIEKRREIRDSKIPDFGNEALARLIGPFIDRMTELMQAQEKQSPAPLTRDDLASLSGQLCEAFERLEDLNIPDSIGRFDLNPGNIVVSSERVVFLDWADSYWGNPFMSFAYLVEHSYRISSDVSLESALKSSYAEPWRAICPPEHVSNALAVAPLLAVFAYTVASLNWRQAHTLPDRRVAAHLRSMTRRMYREAKRIEEARQTCLS